MDYTKICQGWIYTITNKINGKMYVGKTIDYNRRKNQHFFKYEKCSILRRAFEKYGRENFEMIPILNFTAINKEVANNVLGQLEQYYIKKYNTYNDGYNATFGGEGAVGLVMSEEAKEKLRIINTGHSNATEYSRKVQRENISNLQLWKLHEKSILKYDLTGRFIRKYYTIKDALEEIVNEGLSQMTNPKMVRRQLTRALKEHKNSFGFLWIYEDPDNFQLFIDEYKDTRDKPLYHYTKEGELIESFKNVREAENITGINRKVLTDLCSRGDRSQNKRPRKKDYWSRISPA